MSATHPELPGMPDGTPQLPLRWAVIIAISITCGLAAGQTANLAAGITTGLAALVAMHKITR